MSGPGPADGTRLSSIDETTEERFTLSSPRSVEACAEVGVRPEDLQHRSVDSFVEEAQDAGWVADVGRRQYSIREKTRLDGLRAAKTKYAEICMARWKSCVEQVLMDLAAAIDRLLLERQGVYHPDVGKELKSAVACEGRRYARYPPGYALGKEADPGQEKVVSDLHGMCRDVVMRDELLEPVEEWDIMVERCCADRQEDGPKPVEADATGLRFSDIINALEYTFPNTTADEREEAARHGLVLSAASDSTASTRLQHEHGKHARTGTFRCAVATAHRKEPVLACLPCSYCGGKCKQNTEECARCKNKTYCTRQCRLMDWTLAHCRECVELKPVEQRATSLASTWLKANAGASSDIDLSPKKPMPVKWHSIEVALTARSADADWKGVLRMQSEALLSAKALEPEWPERAIGIYNQLSDCYKALAQYDKALEFSSVSLALAEATGSKEMEAQILVDKADLYENTLKNIYKASLCLEQSLDARKQIGDRWGEGRVRVKLGKLLLLQDRISEALEHNEEAFSIAKEIGDQELEMYSEKELFVCNAKLENFQRAFELRNAQVKQLRQQLVDWKKTVHDAQTDSLRDRPRTATSSVFVSSSHKRGANVLTRPRTTETQSRTRICMITKQDRPASTSYARAWSASTASSSVRSVYKSRLATRGESSLQQSVLSPGRWQEWDRLHSSRHGASSTDGSITSFPREQTYVISSSRPCLPQSTPASKILPSLLQHTMLQHDQRTSWQDVFQRSALDHGSIAETSSSSQGHQSFMIKNGSEVTISQFPWKRSDLLMVYTDKSGVKIPAWLRQCMEGPSRTEACKDVSFWQQETKAENNTDLRFPRSPVSFIRPSTVAHAMCRNDDSLLQASKNLVLAWKARQPDTSKEDEEQRKQEEEENERARRLEEAEKAAKIQQELARDEALKANAMRLTDLICEIVSKHLQMFRGQVDSTFLLEERELKAVARHLARELLPTSGHHRALSKILSAAVLFGNLQTDKEAAAHAAIHDHVDLYLNAAKEKP